MVRVVFGTGLDREGATELSARTLGEALEQLPEEVLDPEVRIFVGGVDARGLEGEQTPVGDEDTVLLTRW